MANRLEQELSKSFRSLGWYAIKVPVASKQGISFLNSAPFDYIAVEEGVPYSVEAKMCKNNDTSFPLSRLEAHQIENLLAFEQAGGLSYIVVSFRKPKPVAHAVLVTDWQDMSKELLQVHSRKSVPRSWFTSDPRFITLPRIKVDGAYIWDVNALKPLSPTEHFFMMRDRFNALSTKLNIPQDKAKQFAASQPKTGRKK
jgi:recombination protein U